MQFFGHRLKAQPDSFRWAPEQRGQILRVTRITKGAIATQGLLHINANGGDHLLWEYNQSTPSAENLDVVFHGPTTFTLMGPPKHVIEPSEFVDLLGRIETLAVNGKGQPTAVQTA